MRYWFLLVLALSISVPVRVPSRIRRGTAACAGRTAPPAAADPRPIIAVFGDSISAGYGLRASQNFPDDMQKKLDNWHVVNLGISGDTTEQGVARIDTATSLHPAIVILELGGNDGLRVMTVTSTRSNLEQMIVAFQGIQARKSCWPA